NSSPVETSMKEMVVKKGREVILLVDHTKFNKYAMLTYCQLDEIDYLITDDSLDTSYTTFFKKNHIKWIVAPSQDESQQTLT
ncbi:hypothetical protein VSK70_26885, partial [Bacillus sp. WOD8 KX774193]|nr:hypothetical protein [Bacillus sp. WOD8 KX774193]